MKTTLLALAVAGCCSIASAQSVFFNRSCNTGTSVSFAGNGFSISYSTWSPRVVSWGQPVFYGNRGLGCSPRVPVAYVACQQPVIVNPCFVPVNTRGVAFRPERRVVANPVFPAQGYQWQR